MPPPPWRPPPPWPLWWPLPPPEPSWGGDTWSLASRSGRRGFLPCEGPREARAGESSPAVQLRSSRPRPGRGKYGGEARGLWEVLGAAAGRPWELVGAWGRCRALERPGGEGPVPGEGPHLARPADSPEDLPATGDLLPPLDVAPQGWGDREAVRVGRRARVGGVWYSASWRHQGEGGGEVERHLVAVEAARHHG